MKEIVETKIGLEEARIRYAKLRSLLEEQKDNLDPNTKKQIYRDMLVQLEIIANLDESQKLSDQINLIKSHMIAEDTLESISKGGMTP